MQTRTDIVIPNVLRKVQISARRRPIYYDCLVKTDHGGAILITKKKKIPPLKFFNGRNRELKYLKDNYCVAFVVADKVIKIPKRLMPTVLSVEVKTFWNGYVKMFVTSKQLKSGKYYLYDEITDSRVLANPVSAGTPKYETINYQKLYNGSYHPVTRAKIVTAIKESFLPYLQKYDKQLRDFCNSRTDAIVVEGFACAPYGNYNWDIGNRTNIYVKCMIDLISTGKTGENITRIEPFIEDDNILIVASERHTHVPMEEEGMMFSFFQIDEQYINDARKRYLSAIK